MIPRTSYKNSLFQEVIVLLIWDMQTVDVVCTAAGRTRHAGLQGTENVKAKQSRIEYIGRNPEEMRRIKEQS